MRRINNSGPPRVAKRQLICHIIQLRVSDSEQQVYVGMAAALGPDGVQLSHWRWSGRFPV